MAQWLILKALLSGLVRSKLLKYLDMHWKDRPLAFYFILFPFIYVFFIPNLWEVLVLDLEGPFCDCCLWCREWSSGLMAKSKQCPLLSMHQGVLKCSLLYFTTTIFSKLSRAYTLSGTVPMPSFRFQSIAIFELFLASFLLCVSLALHTKLSF